MSESTYPKDLISDLIDGKLPWPDTKRVMSDFKDTDRFETYISILQERVEWDDPIMMPIGEHLQVVQKASGERVVKCDCGQEFGDYRKNWKLQAAIVARDTEELIAELYPGPKGCDPAIQEIRDLVCPGCVTVLEVEAVPPGHPLNFDFLPDIDGFYADVLDKPLPGGTK